MLNEVLKAKSLCEWARAYLLTLDIFQQLLRILSLNPIVKKKKRKKCCVADVFLSPISPRKKLRLKPREAK